MVVCVCVCVLECTGKGSASRVGCVRMKYTWTAGCVFGTKKRFCGESECSVGKRCSERANEQANNCPSANQPCTAIDETGKMYLEHLALIEDAVYLFFKSMRRHNHHHTKLPGC